MKEKLVKTQDLNSDKFTMHDGKCVFKNDYERTLVLFDHSYTSVMTPCCNFENGRTSTDLYHNTNGWENLS